MAITWPTFHFLQHGSAGSAAEYYVTAVAKCESHILVNFHTVALSCGLCRLQVFAACSSKRFVYPVSMEIVTLALKMLALVLVGLKQAFYGKIALHFFQKVENIYTLVLYRSFNFGLNLFH